MEISYFREFVVLADTRNYWAAAERLFIGESSLSKHIKTLEKTLGAPLFARTSRKVELTEFGKLMLPYAQSVAKLQYEYEAAAYRYLNQESVALNIATIPVIAHYNITDSLVQFQLNHPNVPVNIQEDDTLVVREMLLEHKCDIAIFRDSTAYLEHDPDKESRIVKVPYCTDRLVAVLPYDHPLAEEKEIRLPQLATEYFALIRPGTMPYDLCMRVCKESGFTPQVLFTSHNLEAILDMVRKGSCVSLLFQHHVTFPHNIPTMPDMPGPFAVVPISPEIQTTVCLAYRKGEKLSIPANHFLDYCKMTAPN